MRTFAGVSRKSLVRDLVEIKERCMAAKPVLVRDPEAKELVPSGEWSFDVAGALKAIERLEKLVSDDPGETKRTLSVTEKGELLRKIAQEFAAVASVLGVPVGTPTSDQVYDTWRMANK